MGEQFETPNQRYYVLEQLEGAQRAISLLLDALPECRAQMERELKKGEQLAAWNQHRTLVSGFERLSELVRETCPCLLELEEEQLASAAQTLAGQIAAYNPMTPDYGKLVGILRQFADYLPTPNRVDASVIGRLMNHVKLGFYPTDLENVGYLKRALAFPDGMNVNLLDPCCGDGTALCALTAGQACDTYGIELDGERAEQAQTRLHRVGFGSYFYSKLASEVFHAVFLNPPYLSVINENEGHSRDERRFLIDAILPLMLGGVLIYIIPYYRMTDDICRVLCDNFDDLELYRFTDKEFGRFKQIAVLGRKIRKRDGRALVQDLSLRAYKPENLPCLSEITEGAYPLPETAREVTLFRGAQFNKAELAHQLQKSDSFDRLFSRRKLDSAAKRPPLPLSIGQVGLIGGSGLINGLMDCDCPHLIKGRIIKVRRVSEEANFNEKGEHVSTEIRETYSNRMIFNILTPSGHLRSLA